MSLWAVQEVFLLTVRKGHSKYGLSSAMYNSGLYIYVLSFNHLSIKVLKVSFNNLLSCTYSIPPKYSSKLHSRCLYSCIKS